MEGLFRRTLARKPGALALVDPADKMRVTGQAPRRLTFAQLEDLVARKKVMTDTETPSLTSRFRLA